MGPLGKPQEARCEKDRPRDQMRGGRPTEIKIGGRQFHSTKCKSRTRDSFQAAKEPSQLSPANLYAVGLTMKVTARPDGPSPANVSNVVIQRPAGVTSPIDLRTLHHIASYLGGGYESATCREHGEEGRNAPFAGQIILGSGF